MAKRQEFREARSDWRERLGRLEAHEQMHLGAAELAAVLGVSKQMVSNRLSRGDDLPRLAAPAGNGADLDCDLGAPVAGLQVDGSRGL